MAKSRIGSVAVSVALLISVIVSVLAMSGLGTLTDALKQLLLSSVVATTLCLTAGMLSAALRLKFISADLGYALSMRDATMTLSVGQLAGNLFSNLRAS